MRDVCASLRFHRWNGSTTTTSSTSTPSPGGQRRARRPQPCASRSRRSPAQIRKLEHALDEKLFERRGRNLVLTEIGRVVYRYADEIFALGRELHDTLRGRPTQRPPRLHVGIADVVPKLVVHRLLAAARLAEAGVQLVLREGKPDELLAPP